MRRVALAVGLFGFAAWLAGAWGGDHVVQAVDDLGLLSFAAIASGACWAAAHRHASRGAERGAPRETLGGARRERWAWTVLGAGLAAWTIGEALWSWSELVQHVPAPFPSLADAGFLALPACAAAAMLLWPVRLDARSRARILVDGVLIAAALFVVSWLTVLGPVVAGSGDGGPALWVSVAYPVADVVILSMVVVLGAHARTRGRWTLGLIGLGIALIAVADSAFVYLSQTGAYLSGNAIDIGWATGFAVLALAAGMSRSAGAAGAGDAPDDLAMPGRLRMWFPYLPAMVASLVGLPMAVPLLSHPAAIGGVVVVVVLVARQVLTLADNQRLLLRLDHAAHHDPLTTLANRALFGDRLQRALSARAGVTLVCLDLDHFKQVNDTFGHHAGDELLSEVADRLGRCFRGSDLVARLGGDEFTVLITEPTDPADLVARIHSAFAAPFRLAGKEVSVRPSVGIAICRPGDGDSPEALMHAADLAMYQDKQRARQSPAPQAAGMPDTARMES